MSGNDRNNAAETRAHSVVDGRKARYRGDTPEVTRERIDRITAAGARSLWTMEHRGGIRRVGDRPYMRRATAFVFGGAIRVLFEQWIGEGEIDYISYWLAEEISVRNTIIQSLDYSRPIHQARRELVALADSLDDGRIGHAPIDIPEATDAGSGITTWSVAGKLAEKLRDEATIVNKLTPTEAASYWKAVMDGISTLEKIGVIKIIDDRMMSDPAPV